MDQIPVKTENQDNFGKMNDVITNTLASVKLFDLIWIAFTRPPNSFQYQKYHSGNIDNDIYNFT